MIRRPRVTNAFTVFDPRIIPEPNTGCWLWTRRLTWGYGRCHVAGGGRSAYSYAHRASWEFHRGPIPNGMRIDHICRERSCVNPDHLRVVTPRENAIHNSGSESAKHHAKTCCSRCGGPYVVESYGSRHGRRCVPCRRLRARVRAAAKRVQPWDAPPLSPFAPPTPRLPA